MAENLTIRQVLVWILLPLLNFGTWYYVRRSATTISRPVCSPIVATIKPSFTSSHADIPYCPEEEVAPMTTIAPAITVSSYDKPYDAQCPPVVDDRYFHTLNIKQVSTQEIDGFRVSQLADLINPDSLKGGQSGFTNVTYLLQSGYYGSNIACTKLKWTVRDARGEGDVKCSAVAYVRDSFGSLSQGPLRFDQDIDKHNLRLSTYEQLFGEHGEYKKKNPKEHEKLFIGNQYNRNQFSPIGLFRKVPKERGHLRTVQKLGPFVRHFDGPNGINTQLKELLDERGFKAGSDVVVMVINEGEIDLFLNFVCSCHLHNITTSNVLVFAGSKEIITMIESTGAMGIYHEGYSSVSKKASTDYLDRPFVDMMWYKAFSVYLVLRLKINVLFQDVDLVWFRDPFPVFHNWTGRDGIPLNPPNKPIEAWFSDDAQRSLRYSPFYANSGFYYLKATPRTEYFTWSIMTIYDAVQVLGSHQNVLTTRLVEEFSLTAERTQILSLSDFPGGVHYHHDHAYMKRLSMKQEHPYAFHMCWTQGKPDKLVYLKKAHMWYLKPACSPLENLTPEGHVFGLVLDREEGGHDAQKRWKLLSQTCCQFQDKKSP